MTLLAIDIASNKCGIALFKDGTLIETRTILTEGTDPITRRLSIAWQLEPYIQDAKEVVSEEPLLMGRSNNGMQRLLGYVELLTEGEVKFIHPSTVKMRIGGTGKAEKLEVALGAGELLKTESEKEYMARLISKEEWDATDAVAIGLCFLTKEPI